MKKLIICSIVLLISSAFAQTRSVSNSLILKPKEEVVVTIPEINLQNYEEGKEIITKEKTIIIQGEIKDESEITLLTLNGSEVVIGNDGTFETIVDLRPGTNRLLLMVENITGGKAEKELRVNYTVEYLPPQVEFAERDISNNQNIFVEGREYYLKGNVIDEWGIKSFTLNSRSVDISSDGRFNIYLPLELGENSFSLRVINNKDKLFEKEIKIVSQEILPPSIVLNSIALPSNNILIVNKDRLLLEGKVNDKYGVEEVKLNNRPVNLEADGTFSFQVDLVKGRNSVLLEATNIKNKSISKSFTVFSEVYFTPPEITLIEPLFTETRELTTDDKYVKFRGVARDNYGISQVVVYHNGNVISRGTTEDFQVFVEPQPGVNILTIEASNIKDTSAAETYTLIQPVDIRGPVITITEPQATRGIQVVHKSEILSVKGNAVDESGVFKVLVNNIAATLFPNGDFQTEISLSMGENRMIVEAFDNKYNVSRDTFYVVRELEDLVVGEYYAVVIGIDKYSGYWKPLKNAVNDAKAVAEVLKEYYRIDRVYTMYDEEATEDAIVQKLLDISREMTADDNLLIYYAGHGYLDPLTNRGYWVPASAKINLISKYISNNDLRDIIASLKSKHTLLITDACFAGDIFRGLTTSGITKDPNDMNKYYRQVYSKTSRIAMTSGGIEPVQDMGKEGHSIFTYYLLKALKENSNKYMDVEQLYNEFKVAVTNNSNQSPRLDRIKNTNDEGGQFIFIKKK